MSLSPPNPSDGGEFQLTLVDVPHVGVRPTPQRTREMGLVELRHWARLQTRRIKASRPDSHDESALLMAQTIKLGEEVGELYAEILGASKLQRPGKSGSFTSETLRDEMADVLICVAILAELLDVDLGSATRAKMTKIEERHQEERHHSKRA